MLDSLRQPLGHRLVVYRLTLAQTILGLLSLQPAERVLGAVAVGVCKTVAAPWRRKHTIHISARILKCNSDQLMIANFKPLYGIGLDDKHQASLGS